LKTNSLDDDNQRLKSQYEEDLKEQEHRANRDKQRQQEAHLSIEHSLKEQINKLEVIRCSLERVSN
jgi:hypothetical protein